MFFPAGPTISESIAHTHIITDTGTSLTPCSKLHHQPSPLHSTLA